MGSRITSCLEMPAALQLFDDRIIACTTIQEAQAINLRLMVDLELEKQRLVSLCNLQDHENEASQLLSDELGKLLEVSHANLICASMYGLYGRSVQV